MTEMPPSARAGWGDVDMCYIKKTNKQEKKLKNAYAALEVRGIANTVPSVWKPRWKELASCNPNHQNCARAAHGRDGHVGEADPGSTGAGTGRMDLIGKAT